MIAPFSHRSKKSWKSAIITLTGLCTVLIGTSSAAIAVPQLIAQQATSRVPQTITGQLDQNSVVLEGDSSYYKAHTFGGNAGEVLTIELISNDFDAYLILQDPNGETIATDDDGAGDTNARIVITLPITGTYTIIAKSYQAGEIGNYQLVRRAATITEQDLALATDLNQQGIFLYQVGRYREAEPLFQRALDIREAQLGADHPSTATSLNNLALLYESMGRYSEAEPLYARALDIREAQLGADHPDTAGSLNNLAALYESMGRYSEAEPLYVRALDIYEAQLGADSPYTAMSLNNLALLYLRLIRLYGQWLKQQMSSV